MAGVLGGCEADSWMDPSVTGRWEYTPAEVPILGRIASIEGPEDRFVEVSDAAREDLIPQVEAYRVGPGDDLGITVWDVPVQDQANEFPRIVDPRGMIDLPQIGPVYVSGLTLEGVQEAIARTMIEKDLVRQDPLVTVIVRTARQTTFTVIGAVQSPGPYFIPAADYKLLDALAVAGGFPESTKEIFVIRQIPLSEEVAGRPGEPSPPPAPESQPPAPDAENLIELIEDLSKPKEGGEPGAFGHRSAGPRSSQPEQPPAEPPPPEIGLIPSPEQAQPVRQEEPPNADESTWVFLNGRWVPVKRARAAAGQGADAESTVDLVTQRVLRVRVKPLIAGDARYNVVIRPGDVIRVPAPPTGRVYVGGQINRPGAFDLAEDLTLIRLLDSAGGLNAIAIPERIDLIRMVGDDRQAMVRLNYRAISEGTQPDIFLKANDRINVGTSFWAYPLSVIRNGFRASYGFGFLVDRNFGNDIFGPPPTDDGRGF